VNSTPWIFMMMGRPAAGKTTIARSLSGALSLHYISESEIKLSIKESFSRADSLDEELRDRSYMEAIRVLRESVLSGNSVLLDATFHRRKRRKWVYAVAQEAKCACVILYLHCGDLAETRRRIDRRKTRPYVAETLGNAFEIYAHVDREFDEFDLDEVQGLTAAAFYRIDSCEQLVEQRWAFGLHDPWGTAKEESVFAAISHSLSDPSPERRHGNDSSQALRAESAE